MTRYTIEQDKDNALDGLFYETLEEAKEALENDEYEEGSKIFKVTVEECPQNL